MRVCYGDDSQPVIRADETAAALQRLKWALERTNVRAQPKRLNMVSFTTVLILCSGRIATRGIRQSGYISEWLRLLDPD